MNSGKKEFKVGDVWLDGYGRKVTIIKTDLKNQLAPMVGIKTAANGEESLYTYCSDGTYIAGMRRSEDLVKKYEPPVGPKELYQYVQVVGGRMGGTYRQNPGPSKVAGWRVVKYLRVDEE